jgi:hypothetical protein
MKYENFNHPLIYLATKLKTKYKDLAICIWLLVKCTYGRFSTFANEIIINNKKLFWKMIILKNWSLGASSYTLFIVTLFLFCFWCGFWDINNKINNWCVKRKGRTSKLNGEWSALIDSYQIRVRVDDHNKRWFQRHKEKRKKEKVWHPLLNSLFMRDCKSSISQKPKKFMSL